MRLFICGLILLLSPMVASGQTNPTGNLTVQQSQLWLQGFSTIRLDDHWSIPLEVQVRLADTGGSWATWFPRLALMRDINSHVAIGGGYAYVHSWPYGAQPIATETDENRTFEQLMVKHSFRSNAINHRLRLEQRWVEGIDPDTNQLTGDRVYTNRLRYRPGISVPLHRRDPSRKGLGSGDTFLFLTDEVFVNFGKQVANNTFDQNRFAVGIGHHFPRFVFQGGYLHQYLQKSDGQRFESNHIITIAFTYDIRLE